MLLDTKDILPKYTLPRFNGESKKWLDKEEIMIEETKEDYIVYYKVKRNTGEINYGISLPKKIDLNDKFKLAIVAYMCEGSKPGKGQFTNCSGNKGRSIHFTNSDFWLIRLIIEQFEKIGIKKNRWRVYITLFEEHINRQEKEIEWWKSKLNLEGNKFKIKEILEGDPEKSHYSPHGRARIELTSVIHSALIDNLMNLMRENKL